MSTPWLPGLSTLLKGSNVKMKPLCRTRVGKGVPGSDEDHLMGEDLTLRSKAKMVLF